ncbi:MAG TPA: 50S ribosomal protein L11 methyltransferase [Chitinophagaceae bacterium]|nr:50S ribosomal protein L11 methyltransferase [Chitinophagaceae bacterium]
MDYIKIKFADLQPEQKEILIAQLADAGYEGFEETDTGLDAFINKQDFDKSLLREISYKYQTPYTSEMITATNWNKIWESNFDPVVVEDFVAIRADFHKPIANTKFEIVITPKMSFGTGHHATTYMMIQLMKAIDFTNKSVLDFGTGTGILAILAIKSGAENVCAIDNDEWSIANAAENFNKNDCKKIVLKKAPNALSDMNFDIVLANVNKSVILQNLNTWRDQLKMGGSLLLSGLLETEKNQILEKAKQLNLSLERTLVRNSWIAIQLSK